MPLRDALLRLSFSLSGRVSRLTLTVLPRSEATWKDPMEMTITQQAPPRRDWAVLGRAEVCGALGLVQQIMGGVARNL